jgi:hypothetical protein
MGERELREKYGGKLAKAINRAIRAEIPGGNEALDKLTHLAAPILQSGWEDHHGNPTAEATAYFKHKRNVVDTMEAVIRERWGIAPEASRKPDKRRTRGSTSRDQADRTPDRFYRGTPRQSKRGR